MRLALNFKMLFAALTVGAVVYAIRSGRPVGRFLGMPYDFRAPTIDRVKGRLWNKDDDRIFMPSVFGVGWSLNFFRVIEKFRADDAVEDHADPDNLPPTPLSKPQPLP